MSDPKQLHKVIIGLGSNIMPEKNLLLAIQRLRELDKSLKISSVFQSHSEGSPGPDFLNTVAEFHTHYPLDLLKTKILHEIENDLGRVRTQDKNAPRTMDLDILLFDGQVVDENIWSRVFIAFPLAEMMPDFKNPSSGESIKNIASQLGKQYFVRKFDLFL